MVHTPAVTPAINLRYGNTPCCYCKKRATIKVMESKSKMSKGKLYYSCSLWRCNFFGWLKPEEVIFKDGETFGDDSTACLEEDDEVEEEVNSFSKPLVASQINRNYVHISWVVVVVLCILIFMLIVRV